MMADEVEDFSFPPIPDNLPCLMDSPPWRNFTTDRPQTDSGQQDKHVESRAIQKARQTSDEGGGAAEKLLSGDREEKMDMLWEDFNEELWLWRSPASKEKCQSPSREVLEFGCARTKLSRRSNKYGGSNGGVVSSPVKRAGVVMIMKMLKKLSLLHNTAPGTGPIKKQRLPW